MVKKLLQLFWYYTALDSHVVVKKLISINGKKMARFFTQKTLVTSQMFTHTYQALSNQTDYFEWKK